MRFANGNRAQKLNSGLSSHGSFLLLSHRTSEMLQEDFTSVWFFCVAADKYVMGKKMKNAWILNIGRTSDVEGSSMSNYGIQLNLQILSSLKHAGCTVYSYVGLVK